MTKSDRRQDAQKQDCDDITDDDDRPLQAVIACVRAAGNKEIRDDEEEMLSIKDIVAALGEASFAPLLFVPSIIIVSPLSGIPGLSSLFGILLALIAVQMVIGRSHVWLPLWLMRREMGRARFNKALDVMQKPIGFVDRVTHPRFAMLVTWPFAKVLQVLCVFCGAMMPFFELVPFSSSILALAVAFFSMTFVTRDGVLALLGLAVLACGGALLGFAVGAGIEAVE